jgi:hypothetical protein
MKRLDPRDVRFLLTGKLEAGVMISDPVPDKLRGYLNPQSLQELELLINSMTFEDLSTELSLFHLHWKYVCENDQPQE